MRDVVSIYPISLQEYLFILTNTASWTLGANRRGVRIELVAPKFSHTNPLEPAATSRMRRNRPAREFCR